MRPPRSSCYIIRVDTRHAPASSTARRCTAYFQGRVQGVGFRYTVQNLAMRYNVCGFVRNLPDGRVELILEGPDQEIDQLIEALKGRMSDFINKVELAMASATGEFSRFCIKH